MALTGCFQPATFAHLARIRRALAAVAALAALVLFAPAALAKAPCPPGSIYDPSTNFCFPCGKNKITDAAQRHCIACPTGTTAKFNRCILSTTTPNAAGWARPKPSPGLLESTPTFTQQGPAPSGTPIGPRPGAR
jgi:hypothetical protein